MSLSLSYGEDHSSSVLGFLGEVLEPGLFRDDLVKILLDLHVNLKKIRESMKQKRKRKENKKLARALKRN